MRSKCIGRSVDSNVCCIAAILNMLIENVEQNSRKSRTQWKEMRNGRTREAETKGKCRIIVWQM